MAGVNQAGEELGSDSSCKHDKLQHLQSVLHSEGIDTHYPEASKMEENEDHMDIIETQSSQVNDKNAAENADTNKLSTFLVDHSGSKSLDPNSEMFTDENSGYNDNVMSLGDDGNHSSDIKGKAPSKHKHTDFSTSRWDANTEDVASSANQDPCYGYRSRNHLKIRDTLDCGRITDEAEEKDALRKWKEMKQNGFMSPTYGGIPAAPKQRGRKRKSDVLKQKMEQAKKEQIDRFTKIAAPSGLLNGLNPGIINHVRNSKQVHSIIQALVMSEKRESCKQASEMRVVSRELRETSTDQENTNSYQARGSLISNEVASRSSMPASKLISENQLYNRSFLLNAESRDGFRDLATEEGMFRGKTYLASASRTNSKGDRPAFKPSPLIVSESTSCLSNNKSANVKGSDTLSVKGATVASQWLHLIQQDIKGRLAALHRSKKRVQAVVTTELPFLLSKEFSFNQENDRHNMNDLAFGCSNKASAELHEAKWSKLFHQMDTELSEEEKQLEDWLNQVNMMLFHCDEGLQHVQWNALFEMQHLGSLDNEFRTRAADPTRDLSVRAAAASIYSTCNFLSSRENVSCC
uniref:Uncharacterized protein n=1 Tax=Opuntia streptacantha TaxID=393608 RepID=A0A7C9D8X7_OPUST